MKASELITKLTALIEEYGDLDIYLADWNEDYAWPAKAMKIEAESVKSWSDEGASFMETDGFVMNG